MTKLTGSLALNSQEYSEKHGQYLFFRKSYNGNSSNYKIRLDVAESIHARIYDDKVIFLGLLKNTQEDKEDFWKALQEKFYKHLQKRAHQATQGYWHQSADYIYTFDDQEAKHFLFWRDIYVNTILPNYKRSDWFNLDARNRSSYGQDSTQRYITVYDHLNEVIREKYNKDYELAVPSRSREVAMFALDLILAKQPAPHIQLILEKMRETTRPWPISYVNATVQVCDNDVTNRLVKDLLIAINSTGYQGVNSQLLERIDIYDYTIFDSIAKLLKKRIAKHTGTHRDIVVKVK